MGTDGIRMRRPSLRETHPELADEWDMEKNAPLRPEDVSFGSEKKVWWKCREGHSWAAKIYSRAQKNGSICPVCCRMRLAVPGENDFQTAYPSLAEEWDWEKNGHLTPDRIRPQSNRKVWWRCKKGHSWEATVCGRSKGGHGCPYCSGRFAITGENDLATVNPSLAGEWNYSRNYPLTPETVLPKTNKKVWWICKNGHEWTASVAERSYGCGCPCCSGRRSIAGTRDLSTLCPEIAAEWDEERNAPLTVHDVLPQSFKVVWWRCRKGHSWKARIQSRYLGEKCPYCSGKKAIPGETDLRTLHPELMPEWDELRNDPLKPDEVTEQSGRKAWWRCQFGHSWQSVIGSRTKGLGCPFCSGQVPVRTRLIEL